MLPSLYNLLSDLSDAVESESPLLALSEISRTLRVNLDNAWAEYANIEIMVFELQRENEQLREMTS